MSTGTKTSLYMTDKIVIGVVIVGGTDPSLAFSAAEIALIKAQVLQGSHFLQGADYRAKIRFQYDFQEVTVDVADPISCPTYESCEAPWRNAALQKLGYNTSVEYVDAIIASKKTKWGYVAYFTKYKLKHFAYASGVRLVMNYSNDGWGPSLIHRVFAHESCHIFGAADEYGPCTCNPSGQNHVTNQNCVNCKTPQLPHVTCLMDKNVFSLCTWSRGQIGWGYFKESNLPIANFATWAAQGNVKVITGDFNGNGKTDIALVGGPGWGTQPVAFSNGDGTFNVTNQAIANFAVWAAQAGVKVITGDFNGNGKTDIALVGGAGWGTQPIAFSNGDGTFNVTNQPITNFASWAVTPGVKVITGDFNGNGKTDIALVGGHGWGTQPVAFSNGDGTFNVTNQPITDFAIWATQAGVEVITGDFNGNGKTDIALVGGPGWGTQPVAFSNGDGTFNVTNQPITNFASWAVTPGVKIITGDFNGNGRTDIALVGGPGWGTQPVAFSNGDGTFNVTNQPITNFATWASAPGLRIISGDFNGNGKTDIALVGGNGWHTVPLAFSNGDGTFGVSNINVQNFASWAITPNVKVVIGDFNKDGLMDLALLGGAGWATQPMASYQKGSYETVAGAV